MPPETDITGQHARAAVYVILLPRVSRSCGDKIGLSKLEPCNRPIPRQRRTGENQAGQDWEGHHSSSTSTAEALGNDAMRSPPALAEA
ncbi:hypothetical protein NDU88_004770 [Pleurodeles waltl]|uniref:Uncharacterized protein n=1 Tax=Pleurodeles waltl TaxID=8319 RepID=A0AAV7SJV9_PLEWA|nr:hypothetical protein NDU88_004770 [Pleurodeles waltl]